jgi:hypothetical protein
LRFGGSRLLDGHRGIRAAVGGHLCPDSCAPHTAKNRQQYRHEHGHDDDHHQELDQGECAIGPA